MKKILIVACILCLLVGLFAAFLYTHKTVPTEDGSTVDEFPIGSSNPDVVGVAPDPVIADLVRADIQGATPLEFSPTVIVGQYALQGWWDAYTGGEALFEYRNGVWMHLPGVGPWNVPLLIEAGVPQSVAESLIAQRKNVP